MENEEIEDFDPEDNCMLPVYAPPMFEEDEDYDEDGNDNSGFNAIKNVPAPVYAPPRPPK